MAIVLLQFFIITERLEVYRIFRTGRYGEIKIDHINYVSSNPTPPKRKLIHGVLSIGKTATAETTNGPWQSAPILDLALTEQYMRQSLQITFRKREASELFQTTQAVRMLLATENSPQIRIL